ncbi:hypothetical protein BV22DRAFT_752071 [Leucogyrophana mollusca]|uniref:Uncharacterized protein n=1 Tax=Leucogyrophana mollusca TaxID=85980 RepID=A0ACB8B8M8_9AGAM|nr:hypothetical protein BV22DRAFT_752071 [Leucogyrophana mollusca]
MNSIATNDPFIDFSRLDAALKKQLAIKIAKWGPERKHVAKEIGGINSELMAQFLNPDIRTYAFTCARFKNLADSKIQFLYNELKQIVETLQLMFIMYERFVWSSLIDEYLSCPPDIDDLPSDDAIRSFIISLADQHLLVCTGHNDLESNLLTLKERINATFFSAAESSSAHAEHYDAPFEEGSDNHAPLEKVASQGCSHGSTDINPAAPSTPPRKLRALSPPIPTAGTSPSSPSPSGTRTVPSTPRGARGASLSRTLLFSSQILPPGPQEDVVNALGSLSEIDEGSSGASGFGCEIA